jgi:hypothetical protein
VRGDGVVDGDTAQEIAPKGVGVIPVELRGGGLFNGGEGVGGRGGPQLGQARGAIVLIRAAEVLFLLRLALCFARTRRRGGALLGVLVVGVRAGSVLQDAAKRLWAVARFLRCGDAAVNEVARLVQAVPRNEGAGLGERLGAGGHVGCTVKALVKVLHKGVRLGA